MLYFGKGLKYIKYRVFFYTGVENLCKVNLNQSMFIHLNNPQDFQKSEG